MRLDLLVCLAVNPKQVFKVSHLKLCTCEPLAPSEPLLQDAGANIGMAFVILSHWFPEAKMIAVEPSKENFRMLLANTQKYGNIYPEYAGLWKKFGTLNFSHHPREKEDWGTLHCIFALMTNAQGVGHVLYH